VYRQVKVIAGKGTAPDRFAEALRGLAVDPARLLYAVGDSEVKVFDTAGTLFRRWRTGRPGFAVRWASQKTPAVYVGEEGQVEQFDTQGRLATTWRDQGRLGLVTSVDVFGEYLLVGDATNRCIRRYDRTGRFINDIGVDSKARGFVIPNGHVDFAVDPGGVIHATNPGKHRVERYTLDGRLLGHFGRFGGTTDPEGFGGCCNPTNLALAGQGRIVVTEKAPPRVKVYDTDGSLRAIFGTQTFDPNCKNMDVASDATGGIYVVDTVQLRIHVFAPDHEPSQGNKAAEGKQPS
jgi:hypothetical protein